MFNALQWDNKTQIFKTMQNKINRTYYFFSLFHFRILNFLKKKQKKKDNITQHNATVKNEKKKKKKKKKEKKK